MAKYQAVLLRLGHINLKIVICLNCFSVDKSDICLLVETPKISCTPNSPEITYL